MILKQTRTALGYHTYVSVEHDGVTHIGESHDVSAEKSARAATITAVEKLKHSLLERLKVQIVVTEAVQCQN